MASLKDRAQELLSVAGITINGPNPWDIQVHDERVYSRIFAEGSLGLGESYMDSWWDCQALDQFFARIFLAKIDQKINPWKLLFASLRARLVNLQRKSKAFEIGQKHYDIGNDLYAHMLDKRMTYTCGYWKNAKNLDLAQEAKLDLVCKKIGLKKGMTVLDIGCGWGSFAKFAAQKYGARVVGITVSKEQAELAKISCAKLAVEIRLQDYRDVVGTFDRIVSLGMFEHVGYKNYSTYMKLAHSCLADNGLFLLHTIGGNISVKGFDPWIEKYIFTNSMLPSIKQISESIEGLFVMEDWHNFGSDYDKTLMAWHANFTKHWKTLSLHYTERFSRMWRYYFLSCAASFRSRNNQLWQIVLSKNGVPKGYVSIR